MYPPVHQFLKQTNLQEVPLAWLWLDIALSSSGWRSLRVLVTKSAAANLDLMKIFTMQAGPDQNVSKCYMILYDKITWHIFQLVPEYIRISLKVGHESVNLSPRNELFTSVFCATIPWGPYRFSNFSTSAIIMISRDWFHPHHHNSPTFTKLNNMPCWPEIGRTCLFFLRLLRLVNFNSRLIII